MTVLLKVFRLKKSTFLIRMSYILCHTFYTQSWRGMVNMGYLSGKKIKYFN